MSDEWPSSEPLDPETIQRLFAPTADDVEGLLDPEQYRAKHVLCECSHPLRIHEHRITYDPPPTTYTGIGRCWAADCVCRMYVKGAR